MIIHSVIKKLLFACTSFLCVAVGSTGTAQALTFTSPIGGGSPLPSGVSSIGGVVLDLRGANGNRVTSQLAASQLFQGFYSTNPGTVGTQTGFTAGVLSALGGGISEAAIRFTLFDGDTAANNFDFGDNTLLVNGLTFGNWSSVIAQATSSTGSLIGSPNSGGFRDGTLDTGWFYSNNSALLSSFFGTLTANGQVIYQINDADPGDNFYDFTQGIDAGLISVGTGPVVNPGTPIPTPALLPGLIGMGIATLRKRKREAAQESSEA